MQIDRLSIKSSAKQAISGKKPSAFLLSAGYVFIIFIISLLISNISGIAQYMSEFATRYYDALYAGAEMDLDSIPIPSVTPVSGLILVILALMSALLAVGYRNYCLKLSRNQETRFKDIFSSFDFFFRAIGLILLQGILFFLGTLFFIFPGVILYYRYSMTYYIMFDNPEYGIIQCMRESARLTTGYKGQLFILDLSFLGWMLLDYFSSAFTVFPVVRLWNEPYFGVTRANFYHALLACAAGNYQPPRQSSGNTPNDRFWNQP